jgi:hypothetical protein
VNRAVKLGASLGPQEMKAREAEAFATCVSNREQLKASLRFNAPAPYHVERALSTVETIFSNVRQK